MFVMFIINTFMNFLGEDTKKSPQDVHVRRANVIFFLHFRKNPCFEPFWSVPLAPGWWLDGAESSPEIKKICKQAGVGVQVSNS